MLPSEFLANFHRIIYSYEDEDTLFPYRTTVDQINNEITALDTRIKNIKKQIELPTTEQDVKNQMTEFLLVQKHTTNEMSREKSTKFFHSFLGRRT